MTNPHVDARARACAAAELLFRVVRGEVRPVMAVERPPLIVNILRQGTSDPPMRHLIALAAAAAAMPGVLSVSIAEGFPYADVAEMGMSFLAVTDGDVALANAVVGELARAAWDVRTQFQGTAMPVDDALRARGDRRIAPGGPARCRRQRPRRRPGRFNPRPGGGATAGSAWPVPLALRPRCGRSVCGGGHRHDRRTRRRRQNRRTARGAGSRHRPRPPPRRWQVRGDGSTHGG